MIDDSPSGSWTRDKDMDLRGMTSHKLQQDETVEAIRQWHGLATMAEAKELIGKELRRRTRETSTDIY